MSVSRKVCKLVFVLLAAASPAFCQINRSITRGNTYPVMTNGALATPGSVIYSTTSGAFSQDNANFFWDDTNHRHGIGTAAPSQALELYNGTGYWGKGMITSTATACGANVTFVGGNGLTIVTTAGSAVATCSITWSPACRTGSHCYVDDDSRTTLGTPSYAFGVASATATFSGNWTAGDKISFDCTCY